MANLTIKTGTIHRANQPFLARVAVAGARPDDRIHVRLRQADGVAPFYSNVRPADIDAGRDGLAEFDDVVLHGAGSTAVLIAEAVVVTDNDIALDTSAAAPAACELHIQVVP
ncbi:MAG TPA: hypothetical protein VIX73_26315 [Kofleriaceae bacterium]|jgi:hypothetical protein